MVSVYMINFLQVKSKQKNKNSSQESVKKCLYMGVDSNAFVFVLSFRYAHT